MGKKWTKEEDDLLRRWYRHRGSPYLETVLDRSRTAIQARALSLGIRGTSRRWTRKEELYLERNHGRHTVEVLADRLGRKVGSVQSKAFLMGLTGPASRAWSGQEVAYLRRHYGNMRARDIAEHLGRSTDAIELKAGRLGLRRSLHRITSAEKKWVIRNLGKISYHNMADELGVSAQTIQQIAHANGYRPRPYMRRWSDQDVAYLRKHYGRKTAREIAEHLDRTIPTVRTLAGNLGLTQKRNNSEKFWTSEEERILRANYHRCTIRELAAMLDRTVPSVNGKARGLGLSKKQENVYGNGE